MKIRSLSVAILSIVVIFGGILLADQLGLWQTESSKEPARFSEGAFKGQPNPDDIRGSYTFSDIESIFDIDVVVLSEAFQMTSETPGTIKAKDVEEAFGEYGEDVEIGTGSVKQFVSIYTGLPYDGLDYLPESAVDLLRKKDKWTDDVESKMSNYILDVTANDKVIEPVVESDEEHEEKVGVFGKTTVSDLLAYGLSLDEIEQVLGLTIENENMLIRDICTQNGLSFSVIKEELNDLID